MTTPIHPDIPAQKIACSVFLEEVPLNLACTPDGADYIGHYCGNDCYETFLALNNQADAARPESKLTGQK